MRRSSILLLPLIFGLVACARCGNESAHRVGIDGLLRRLPHSAQAVVLVPDLAILGEKISVLQKLKIASFVAQLQGLGSAEEYVSALMGQVGIDLRLVEDLRKIGLRPDGGVAVALLDADGAYAVVAVKDEHRFERALERFASDRLGAKVIQRSEAAGQTRVAFSRAEGSGPELGVIFDHGYAWVAGAGSASRLANFAGLTEADSLAHDAALAAGLDRLPKERDGVAYFPSAALLDRAAVALGAVITVHLASDALVFHADLPWQDEHGTLEKLVPHAAPSLLGVLPEDAFLVARFTGDATVLDPYWPALLGAGMQRAVTQLGINVKEEVLGGIKPGGVAALSIASTLKLATGMPALDIRRTNPFHYVHLTAAAQLKDSVRGQQILDRVPALAARVGAVVTPTERQGQRVFLTSYAQGEGTHLALKGDTLVVAAPEQRLWDALANVAKPGPGPMADPRLRQALEQNAFSAVIDLRRLAASVKALPSEAWGVGGFAIKATTVRWLEATDDLRAITFGASARSGAIQAELALRFAPQ